MKSAGTQWKLADFNLATTFDPNEYMAEHVGTTPFKAPEVEDMKYTEKCDIYSNWGLFWAGWCFEVHVQIFTSVGLVARYGNSLHRFGDGKTLLAARKS